MSDLSICPKCGKNTVRCKVSLFLDIDMKAFHRLSKKTLRTKLVRVEGADWPRMAFYCSSSKCNGYFWRADAPKESQG